MVSAVHGSPNDAPLLNVTVSGTAIDQALTDFRREEVAPTPKPRSEFVERLDLECQAIRDAGYNPAVTELLRLALELERRRHTLFLEGAAAGSTLFFVGGLTGLNPCEHGLLTERFVSVGEGSDGFPEESDGVPLDLLSAQVSMSRTDLLMFLRQRGYTICVEADSIPGYPTRTITAAMRRRGSSGPAIQLSIETTRLAVLSNSVGRMRLAELERDVQTWDRLAAGDTEGIEPLESRVAQSALRARKPKTLLGLADVLALSRPNGPGSPDYPVVYQEDLMQSLHADIGISLRAAWNLIHSRSAPRSPRRIQARQWFFGDALRAKIPSDVKGRLWAQLSEQCPGAVCKAHYLVMAHHCLRAAYLKAHYPGQFRAMANAIGG
jgi:DNA polymerase III alpha subunit